MFLQKEEKVEESGQKKTKERKYKNDRVVEIKEDNPNWCEIDYLEWGVCKLFIQEECFELAKYLCKLDFVIAKVIGLNLHRSKSLEKNREMCDFCYKLK